MRARADIVSELPQIDLVDDAGDNLLLATAVAGDADHLANGDRRHLLRLKKVQRARILTAREFGSAARLTGPDERAGAASGPFPQSRWSRRLCHSFVRGGR